MDDHPEQEAAPARRPRRGEGGIPLVRVVVVLALFVGATALALGSLHATSATTPPPAGAGTTTTTAASHASTTTTSHPPSSVAVLVANATGVSGAAASITNQLQTGGWSMQPPVNASARVTVSHVYYLAGKEQEAAAVAAALHLPSSAVVPYTTAAPVSSIGTADIVVVVGPDLASPSGSSATTTTAASHASGT